MKQPEIRAAIFAQRELPPARTQPSTALVFPTRAGGLAAGPPPRCLLGWTYVERDSALLSVPIGFEDPS